MVQWYVSVLKKYAVFNGRAGRSEFWWFTLANAIVAIVLYIPAIMAASAGASGMASVLGVPYILYLLATLLPSLGLAIRRLHDTGRSGWWLLIGLVPFVGGIILLIFYILDSTPGDNQFGPHPSSVPMAASVPA